MKYAPFGPVPWDLMVFLSITMTGLGISVNRLSNLDRNSSVVMTQSDEPQSSTEGRSSQPVVDLGCLDRRPASTWLTSEHKTVRFKGRFCNLTRAEMKEFQSIRMKNLSSGDDGLVFMQGQTSQFVTDIMDLSPGKNLIQIEWQESSQSKPKMVMAEVYDK